MDGHRRSLVNLHADMKQKAVVHAAQQDWHASPMPGVARRMLHRVGNEVAQATSLVRYAPGSPFSAHTHTGGEEFLVLEGVFQDEHGDYPAGTYIRNPPTTRHTPSSAQGCTIFVKLWQFDPQDRTRVIVQTDNLARIHDAQRPGVQVSPLYRDALEDVRLEEWAPQHSIALDLPHGGEFLVLQGSFTESGEPFATHSWLRLPSGSHLHALAGAQGAKLWVKLHHLDSMQQPPVSD
jgi:anti-sigma factor ChrR (cupin superfamily)